MNTTNHVKEPAKTEHTYAQISYIKVAFGKAIVCVKFSTEKLLVILYGLFKNPTHCKPFRNILSLIIEETLSSRQTPRRRITTCQLSATVTEI